MIEEGEDVAILFVRLQKVVHLLLAGKNRHCPEPSRCNRTGGIGKPYCIPNFLLCPLLNGLGTFKNSREQRSGKRISTAGCIDYLDRKGRDFDDCLPIAAKDFLVSISHGNEPDGTRF